MAHSCKAQLDYSFSKWVSLDSGPGIIHALSETCFHCAATMKNWIRKEAVSGTRICFGDNEVYLLDYLVTHCSSWKVTKLFRALLLHVKVGRRVGN